MKMTSGHKGKLQDSQKGTEEGQAGTDGKISRLGKTHADYWSARLRKRSFKSRDGKTEIEIPTWQVRLKHLGREAWFNLDTASKAAGAIKARDIYLHLISPGGWAATLAKFKPGMEVSKNGCTVGEFLDQVRAVSGLRPGTLEVYCKKFRSLVAGVFKVEGGKAKHDYVGNGHKEWLERVHATRLDRLTPDRVNAWKVAELKEASHNPLQLKHANATVRSVLLNSKALFSPNITRHLTLRLPSPLPFEGVVLPEIGKNRYKSEINPALLLQQAKRELAKTQPEHFKIILLALGAGLRRDEIDKLQWQSIKWDKHIIRVETTEHGGTKSADSEADVSVDASLLAILKTFMPKPGMKGSPFVIQSKVAPRPQSVRNHHYRCARAFRQVVRWLRSKGISARCALHSLRKEFGSLICQQGGIFAASVALRHSSIAVTRDFYLDAKEPVALDVGKLLAQQR